MQKRPGKGKPLSLAAGQILRVLRQLHIQSVAGAQKLIQPALLQNFPKLFIIRVRISHQKVVPDAALEQVGTGSDIGHPSHAALLAAFGEMVGTDHDRAAVHCISACEERGDGGFAAAALADNTNKAVLRDLHVDLAKDIALPVIGEGNAL